MYWDVVSHQHRLSCQVKVAKVAKPRLEMACVAPSAVQKCQTGQLAQNAFVHRVPMDVTYMLVAIVWTELTIAFVPFRVHPMN